MIVRSVETSRELAKKLEVEHTALKLTYQKHEKHILDMSGGVSPVKSAYKTDGRPGFEYIFDSYQALLLITMAKNTQAAIKIKKEIVLKIKEEYESRNKPNT